MSEIVKIENIEKRLEKAENKIDKIEKAITKSTTEISVIFNILNEIKDDTKAITKDLGEMKLKPAKKWDGAITTIIAVTVSTITAYILAKGGI